MSETAATTVYLAMACMFLAIACWKGLAFLREPTPTLALMTGAFAMGGVVYAAASPAVYRGIGEALGQPWIATLPIYIGILMCYGCTHVLTLLWTAGSPDEPRSARRTITAWVSAYGISMAIMTGAFLRADLEGPADPLRFNTQQADEPHVLLFLGVFLTMLTSGTLNTWRRSRRTRLNDARLEHAIRWFAGSMLVVFGYVVCSVPAIVAAATGHKELDDVGVLGSCFGIVGCFGTCYGMSGAAVSAWLRERRDILLLEPLWDLVVAGVDEQLSFSSAHRPSSEDGGEAPPVSSTRRPNRFINVRWTLHRMVVEILDGIRELRVWISDEPKQVLEALYHESLENEAARAHYGIPKEGLSPVDLEAAATAAVLRDAVERFQAARESADWGVELPLPDRPAGVVPGKETAPAEERPRLLRVAYALHGPLVEASLQVLHNVRDADQPCSGAS
ncbi:hypothetical protein PV726_31775 [Streptomyces europaeiscabiei]|uniref:DUF6545 domain-containing protein n=1 Tax=Streptomyces europaeiscabiei TaxID=146819 RepID=UPI0029B4F7DC|nr:DUF6545 domain-containing protein [Streptomyces europaeiscabiei]MDX3694834.1 hypothetical protein [Streptomyces europaeiscabiei]